MKKLSKKARERLILALGHKEVGHEVANILDSILVDTPVTSAPRVSYAPYAPAIWNGLHPVSVQEALDDLTFSLVRSGTIEQLPKTDQILLVGEMFFVTDQGSTGKPVWFNGRAWIDAYGTVIAWY